MKNIINDDMIKESKIWKIPMIIFFVLTALFPLALIWNDIHSIEFIFGELFFALMSCYFLYGYLYTHKYRVIITTEKIELKTLFKSIEIKLKDIKAYYCKRYKKSEFYQFFVFAEGKNTIINTRHKDDLETLLKENNVLRHKEILQ